MLERLFSKVDFLPGAKTTIVAGAIALLFWGNMVGLFPQELLDALMPWLEGLLGGTLGLKLVRS